MNYQYLDIYKDGVMGIIKINRPEVHNALNRQTILEISNALDKWQEHEGIFIIVITGSGNKSFISGADIKELSHKTMLQGLEGDLSALCNKIERCDKVTIAAVNGYAFGGGFEVALACDIRIASNNAKFAFPELNLGIIPGGGGTKRFASIVGKGIALNYILTGDPIDAEKAESLGIVAEVVSQNHLWETVIEKSRKISKKGPMAIKLAKFVINEGYDSNVNTALALEKLAQALLFTTNDKKEGTQAFMEKRSPLYQGN